MKTAEKIEADFIVVAMGISPNTDYLKDSGIEFNKMGGIVIDKYGKTNIPDIYPAGDITATTAIWSPAVKQAIIAAEQYDGKYNRY